MKRAKDEPKVAAKKPKMEVTKKLEPVQFPWTPAEELSTELNITLQISSNICRLLDEGNSIPFIARYRKEQSGGMEPDTLRVFKESYESLQHLQEKSLKCIATVEKSGNLTPAIRSSMLCARTAEMLEVAYAPFKTGHKASLAERARALGLGEVAENLLEGRIDNINVFEFVDAKVKGKSKAAEVETGIQHIMADLIVHDKDIAGAIRSLQKSARIGLETKQNTKEKKETKTKALTAKSTKKTKEEDPRKFENYFSFSNNINYLKPHQILAINRGEALKILTVKVNLPDDWLLGQLQKSVRFRFRGRESQFRANMILTALKDAYKRLISPAMIRTVRADLTKMAENAAITSFAENLRKLLLTQPFRGYKILSIDPGFSHGCKVAVISENGCVLDTTVIYPRFKNPGADEPAIRKLCELAAKYRIEYIAIGNGTACRETQDLVSHAIETGRFAPIKIRYTIVEERGASIYSCSPLAAKEFPKMEANLISAVSLGRRVQDPLSEYVKIKPHHLGCGMYQHDISQTKLNASLDEIVVECVSFVGVNVNSCSEHLLQRVAGLTAARAKAIVDYREKNGDFSSRADLKKVKGIGEKVFQQCAGFIRICKTTSNDAPLALTMDPSGVASNPLDATNIHPESYEAAGQLVALVGGNVKDVGDEHLALKVTSYLEKENKENIAQRLAIGVPTLELITDCLKQGVGYDMRQEFDAQIFRAGMTRMEDVHEGTVLTGRVTNVTDFGAFVDIGVGKNGLIHVSKMKGRKVELGNRVEVKIINKDLERGKIGLELVSVL